MSTAVWTVFAVAVMIGIFATCTAAVVLGVRAIERALAKHRTGRTS